MTNWPIGLSTGCFHDSPIGDCLPLIRESGFSLVEVCSAPKHLDYHDAAAVRRAASLIEELGMEAFSFHAPFADHIDITSPDDQQRNASVAEILLAAEAAAQLQVHYFVVHPGPEHAAREHGAEVRLARMQHAVDALDRVASRCCDLGIMCVLENKLPHLLFGTTSDILWILDGIRTPSVGACLDTGHAMLSGDLHHLVRKLAGHLRMLHMHDNNGRGDDHLPPGDGMIDWRALLQALVQVRFRGALVLELAGTRDPAETLAKARRGRAFLRQQCRPLALEPRG